MFLFPRGWANLNGLVFDELELLERGQRRGYEPRLLAMAFQAAEEPAGLGERFPDGRQFPIPRSTAWASRSRMRPSTASSCDWRHRSRHSRRNCETRPSDMPNRPPRLDRNGPKARNRARVRSRHPSPAKNSGKSIRNAACSGPAIGYCPAIVLRIHRAAAGRPSNWRRSRAMPDEVGSDSTLKPRFRWASGDRASVVLLGLPVWRPTLAWSTA